MLTEFLYRNAEARPDGVAVVYREKRVTHAGLVERVERLAGGLASQGVGAGDAVALLLSNDPTFVTSYHAIAALGAVVVPLNPAFKADELQFCFSRCGVRAVISDDRSAGICEGVAAGWDDTMAEAPGTADLSSIRLAFSAGTALPRAGFDAIFEEFGVPIRQLNGCTEAGALAANLDIDPNENLLVGGIVDSHGLMALVTFVGKPVRDHRRAGGDHLGELRQRRKHLGIRRRQAAADLVR